jgi:hypothetical protein
MINDSIFPRKDKVGMKLPGVTKIKWNLPVNDRSAFRVRKLTNRKLMKGVDMEESRNRAPQGNRSGDQNRDDYPFITGYSAERPRGTTSGR